MFYSSPYEIEAIESFLEKEAASGWMFIRCSGVFFIFEECEAIKLKFQIDFFDKATIFDTNPEEETLDYIEYCKESGWHHVFSSGKMQIFYSTQENPVPIQTDEDRKLKLAAKATLLAKWASWIFLPLIWGLTMGLRFVTDFMHPRYYSTYSYNITDLSSFGFLIFWLGFTLFAIINMIRFAVFYFKNKRRLKKGQNIQYYSMKNVKVFHSFCLVFLLLLYGIMVVMTLQSGLSIGYYLVLFIGLVFLLILVDKLVYSKWANRQFNIVLTIILPLVVTFAIMGGAIYFIVVQGDVKVSIGNTTYFYSKDKIDFTLEDLGFDKPEISLYEETIHDKSESFLGKREEYSDYYNTDHNSYGYSINIFSSKYKSIMNKYNDLVLRYRDYSFTEWIDTENTGLLARVYYGTGDDVPMYVVIREGITFVIKGDLNKAQAAKLSAYYMKKK